MHIHQRVGNLRRLIFLVSSPWLLLRQVIHLRLPGATFVLCFCLRWLVQSGEDSAWVQLESEGGGYIIRKPLGQTPETRQLSCWAWYMGWPQDKFEFGAHDYRGGSDAQSTHETLLANGTVADDGSTHFIALVVSLRVSHCVCRPPLIP